MLWKLLVVNYCANNGYSLNPIFAYLYFGSSQLLLSLNTGLTNSSPHIFLPAFLGFLMNAVFHASKYVSIAFLHSATDL